MKGRRLAWTREQALAGLRRFYARVAEAPAGFRSYDRLRAHQRLYPTVAALVRYFPSMVAAWAAIGVAVRDYHRAWSAGEDAYLAAHLGRVPTAELARRLGRTEGALRQHVREMGLSLNTALGWTFARVRAETGLSRNRLIHLLEDGALPCVRGATFIYIDPADLIGLPGARITDELERVARYRLVCRLVGILGRRIAG